MSMMLGVDTGGTFTDFVLLTQREDGSAVLSSHKVLSTPEEPERAILQGISEMGLAAAVAAGAVRIIHGSTVATNAALEGRGVRTAFVTNEGFRDMLTIGRQTRPSLYALESPPREPPVPEVLCLEVPCRMSASGEVLAELSTQAMDALVLELQELKPAAVAINLLFSFLNDAHEKRLEAQLRERLGPDVLICRSSAVLPEYKEYERGIATWLNASLGPLVKNYLLRLKAGTAPCPLAVMQSSGGTIDAEQAADRAVNLLLSGPAGGLAAAAWLSAALGESRLMTFDMGGTSTDAALIRDQMIKLSNEGSIGAYPVAVPMVDMHTIGAGGGSIASVDEGGLLRVGPRSAGARPGPAAYGLGGGNATVTDANLLLGRLLPEAFLGGAMTLDAGAARQALSELGEKLALTPEEAALGVLRVANEHMARALRVISVEKGYDPGDFRLCCFGGAGGLHICALADELNMKKALVPVHAGVLSALGMLLAPVERQVSRSVQRPLRNLEESATTALIQELEALALADIGREDIDPASIEVTVSADLRYLGQSFYLNLPWPGLARAAEAFHEAHEKRYGHRLPGEVELVNLRAAATSWPRQHEPARLNAGPPAEPFRRAVLYSYPAPVPVYLRPDLRPGQRIEGPALICEANATTLVETAWTTRVDDFGNLLLDRCRQDAPDAA